MNKPLTFKVTIMNAVHVGRTERNYPKTKKVTKQEIANFIAMLFESDIE